LAQLELPRLIKSENGGKKSRGSDERLHHYSHSQ